MSRESRAEASRRYRERHPDRIKEYERSDARREKKRLWARRYRLRRKTTPN